MKKFRKLAELPIIGRVVKWAMNYMVSREASEISIHFSKFLKAIVATNQDLKNSVYKIRHEVYCSELKFEEPKESGMELDDFDAYSIHCMIRHLPTKNYAGTVRIVRPTEDDQLLPIEKYCLHSINHETLNPSHFRREHICEISRLAVPADFRKRSADKFSGAATGAINEQTYSEEELRCFPFIAIGLYLTAASIIIQMGIKHAFVMMEPRLARSLKFVGIQFIQLGPAVDYHGLRAPYYINPELLFQNLTPGFKSLLKNIKSDVLKQIDKKQL